MVHDGMEVPALILDVSEDDSAAAAEKAALSRPAVVGRAGRLGRGAVSDLFPQSGGHALCLRLLRALRLCPGDRMRLCGLGHAEKPPDGGARQFLFAPASNRPSLQDLCLAGSVPGGELGVRSGEAGDGAGVHADPGDGHADPAKPGAGPGFPAEDNGPDRRVRVLADVGHRPRDDRQVHKAVASVGTEPGGAIKERRNVR